MAWDFVNNFRGVLRSNRGRIIHTPLLVRVLAFIGGLIFIAVLAADFFGVRH